MKRRAGSTKLPDTGGAKWRETRITILANAGYDVDVRLDQDEAEELDHEARYDLIIVALHRRSEDAAAYTNRVKRKNPTLPILLLTDYGVYVPHGTLSQSIETGDPRALIIASFRDAHRKSTD